MKDTEYIICIYNYLNLAPELHNISSYYFLYFLDERGLLDTSSVKKLYDERFKAEESQDNLSQKLIGPFESIDQLSQFSFQLCEKLNAGKVSNLSVQEYNILLEGNQLASDFYRDLIEQGNVIENIERKKKGFLKRFF